MRTLLILTLWFLAACGDDGKKKGEPCLAHEECASRLCTVPTGGGLTDGGAAGKVCAEPAITR